MNFLNKYFGTIKREDEDLIISAKEAKKIQKNYNYDKIYYNLKEYINPIIKAAIKSNLDTIRICSDEKMFSEEEINILKNLGYKIEKINISPQAKYSESILFLISW